MGGKTNLRRRVQSSSEKTAQDGGQRLKAVRFSAGEKSRNNNGGYKIYLCGRKGGKIRKDEGSKEKREGMGTGMSWESLPRGEKHRPGFLGQLNPRDHRPIRGDL